MALIDQRIIKAQEALEAAKEKLKQAKALKQKKEAKDRAANAKVERSADTRRKILLGAAILAKVGRGEWTKEQMLSILDTELTRPDDRVLFSLPIQQEN
jgi:multidrug resistance efflux pump